MYTQCDVNHDHIFPLTKAKKVPKSNNNDNNNTKYRRPIAYQENMMGVLAQCITG